MALVMLLCSLLASCGGGDGCEAHKDDDGDFICDNCRESIPDTRMDYTVTVKDGSGEVVEGVIVMIYDESDANMENRLSMKMTKDDGKVSFKLEAGTYTVKLVDTKEVHLTYDREKITLTEARPNLVVTVYDALEEKIETMAGEKYKVGVGSYLVDFSDENLSYFVFVPERTGIYEISIIADTQVELGGYGDPWNILGNDNAEHPNGSISTIKITVNLQNIGSGLADTTKYTLGIRGRLKSGTGTLVVKKVGDVQIIPENKAPVPDDLSKVYYRGGVPEDINITVTSLGKRYNAVYNSNDGYYHLCMEHSTDGSHVCEADGPIIYLRLASDDGYLNFAAMLEAGNGMKCTLYNAAGIALERKDYTEMLAAYIEASDDTYGIHPLTEELREAIQNCGEYMGWFDSESPDYKFEGLTIMSRYKGMEYLLFCCYGE